ncbi:MAG TPA: zinc ribbon domain-containing protein [Anaerolineales bacterium]
MPGLSNITNVWNNLKEIDLRPLRQEALDVVKLALVGSPGTGREALAAQMRRDPSRPNMEIQTPLMVLDLDGAQQVTDADLVILIVKAGDPSIDRYKTLTRNWTEAGKQVLVFVNQPPGEWAGPGLWVDWGQKRVVYGSVENTYFLQGEFAAAVMELVPDHLLSLGRHFPLFRVPIARHLINETSFSNATYALSTGLAEIVPLFDIPLNVADIVVLTKAQAFLVYKLGLELGLSTRWQDYVAEFGGVLGGGFVWRQVARSLIGFIPAWGIIPKVAVSYAGTYVVGNVVLQWYLTGRHVTSEQMRELYRQAFEVGKNLAANLVNKVPRPRLRLGLNRRKPRALPDPELKQVCPNCGRTNASDAQFCQYCGQTLSA